VPPQVAALGPVDVDIGALHHNNVLHRGYFFECSVRVVLQRGCFSTAELAVGRDHQLRVRINDSLAQRFGGKAPEHHAVRHPQPGAGEHGEHRLGDHRQLDGHSVPGLQAQR
jgi:hypothetical protein